MQTPDIAAPSEHKSQEVVLQEQVAIQQQQLTMQQQQLAMQQQQQLAIQQQQQQLAMQQQQQQQNVWSHYLELEQITKEHNKRVLPRKKAANAEMVAVLKKQKIVEHDQEYFRLKTDVTKVPLDDAFLRGVYKTFEESEGRELDAEQPERFIAFMHEKRAKLSQHRKPKTRVVHSNERPTELFFS